MKISVLVVDDEPLARSKIVNWLKKFDEVAEVQEAQNGFEAVELTQSSKIDLIFLDIQMPEMSGFELLEKIEKLPLVIFVTAFDKFAIEAFKVNALDYLLKPFDKERFENAFLRAIDQLKQIENLEFAEKLQSLLESQKGKVFLEKITVRLGKKISILEVREIKWFKAEGNYVKIFAESGNFLIRDSLLNLEKKLNPQEFQRIHKSYILNTNLIQELQSASHGDYHILLKDSTKLTLSRNYKDKFCKALELKI
ncbi:MAG: DNA-binding response regulator [Calditrichaeota bacterium]|nr:MAG: DNA-binding response regulator [Calditrichota bacterium]